MRVLVAEDDSVSRRRLEITLPGWGYEPLAVRDGNEAWERLIGDEPPPLALLDWMMPGRDGVDLCRALRRETQKARTYVILVTARARPEEVVEGLEAGADDYLKKPYRNDELRARLGVGQRMVSLERQLSEQVARLEEALSQVKQLQGFLPICSYCKKVRDDKNSWQQIEVYVSAHSEATFSHGICPACIEANLRPELDALKQRMTPKDK